MSQSDSAENRTARERLWAEQERQQNSRKRYRTLKVAGAMIAVLSLVGVGGFVAANQDAGGGGDAAEAKPIAQGDPKGQGAATLTIYEDFRCPACKQFEEGFRDTIEQLRRDGKLRTEYHLVTIIDDNMGGNGSTYAANAAACAQDEGRFQEYHDLLFSKQPAEQDDAYGDKGRLLDLAGQVEGLDSARFRACVEKGEHASWVERSNDAFLKSGHNATPTVLLDGENIYADQDEPLTPEKLRELVEEKAKA
ncbi:DsbA family protein [Streptomyces oceani]|uniref:Thioredoxin-like fold domain-containing protein n=1 Tax=Streptomyces oceani TaxID=1075402 RepID=A0A1E7JZJ3_9ACTN|nr:thioredoxin domain-containing protein [Streptomyces oceani]OEU97016.1 hypothetical protein AN216_17290 [Streptomyces oceani]